MNHKQITDILKKFPKNGKDEEGILADAVYVTDKGQVIRIRAKNGAHISLYSTIMKHFPKLKNIIIKETYEEKTKGDFKIYSWGKLVLTMHKESYEQFDIVMKKIKFVRSLGY